MPVTTTRDDTKTVGIEIDGGVQETRIIDSMHTISEFVRDSLTGRSRRTPTLFFFECNCSGPVVVIAGHAQAALDELADSGHLDPAQVDEQEARESEREYARLGNASEPFDLEYIRLREIEFEDIHHFGQRLTFHADGWMHLWANNKYNDDHPFRDTVVVLDEDFGVDSAWDFRFRNDDGSPEEIGEHAEEQAHRRIWHLINEHC